MKRFNWSEPFAESFALPLAAAVFTAAWVEPWVRWALRLGGSERPFVLSPLFMAGLMFAASLLARRLLITDYAIPRARALLAVLSFIVVLGINLLTFGPPDNKYLTALINWGHAISPQTLALIVTCLLWWRGLTLGNTDLPHDSLASAFFSGVAGLALLFGLNILSPQLTLAEGITPALIFFAAALSALALAGLEEDRRLQRKATGSWPGLNRRWLGTVTGLIGLIVLAGLIIGIVVAPEGVLAVVRPIVDVLSLVALTIISGLVYLLMWPAFYLALQLWDVLAHIIDAIPRPPPGDAAQNADRLTELVIANPVVQSVGQTLAWVLIAAVILWIFWGAARRLFLLSSGAGDDETRENILSRDLLLKQLKSLFGSRRPDLAPPPYLPLDGDLTDPRLIIRRAYRAMLEWAKAQGQPRQPKQTPLTYASALSQSMPHRASSIATLTQAYIAARYAAESPSLEIARRAEAALVELQRTPEQ
jgi:hypothetical protein